MRDTALALGLHENLAPAPNSQLEKKHLLKSTSQLLYFSLVNVKS